MLLLLVQYGIDFMANCKICYKPLGLYKSNNQVYCSDDCYAIAKKTKDRITSQRKVLENILNGRICKRCKKRVHEKGMRYYCASCRKDMEPKPKIKKQKTNEPVKKVEMCERCKKKPKWSDNEKTKYCLECKETVHLKQSRETAKKLQEERDKKAKEDKGGKKQIDPKWLSRGLKK